MARARKSKAGDAGRAELAAGPVEVSDEQVEVISRAAAIDVAKDSGMVCLRVPGPDKPGRRVQRAWSVSARYAVVVALMAGLAEAGVQRLVLESTSGYWRLWYYLAEAAGLEAWLVNARDVKHLPGRPETGKLDCTWLCKLNERGMLRRSFVPPREIRDLRALTRLRARLAQDQARHQARIEKVPEDALLKISVVICGLTGSPGRRFLAALVAGERDPATLAALGDRRLKASRAELAQALTGELRDVHATETGALCRLIDQVNAEITELDGKITAQLAEIPGIQGACTGCGEIAGSHTPGCARAHDPVLPLLERLDEITGTGIAAGQVVIAELGTDPSTFPAPGHAAARARLTSRTIQSGGSERPGRTGKGDPCLRAVPGRAVMTTAKAGTYPGARYRRLARRRGKSKAIAAAARTICEIAWLLICNPELRFAELGPGYYDKLDADRKTRSKIRELERLNPGMQVTLTPVGQAA